MSTGGWTVAQVARMSGVSVRTLHHYDEVGLLEPACVGANGYRYYGRDELLRLQQILFHRELGLSLGEIGRILSAEGFDRAQALRAHKARLEADIRRRRTLVRTIDATLAALKGETTMNERAMYRGFDPEVQAAYEKELVETRGPGMQDRIDQAKAGMNNWRQADFDAMQAESEAIEAAMASALAQGLAPDCATVKALMARQHAWITRSWNREAPAEAFEGLGRMYVEDARFTAHYDGRAPGLAEYMAAAISAYATSVLRPQASV